LEKKYFISSILFYLFFLENTGSEEQDSDTEEIIQGITDSGSLTDLLSRAHEDIGPALRNKPTTGTANRRKTGTKYTTYNTGGNTNI
jgi:hypothetical protein